MPANETGTDREAGQEPPKEISVLISGEWGQEYLILYLYFLWVFRCIPSFNF